MASPDSACTLVIANLTASTPKLLEEVTRRDLAGSRQFLLLIPPVPEHTHPDWTPEAALGLLNRAAPHAQVQNLAAGADAMATLKRTVRERKVDEVIVSTVPVRLARWLRRDLPHRVEKLGLPVTVIPCEEDHPDAERLRELGGIAAGGSVLGK
jgi:hypothetical protein